MAIGLLLVTTAGRARLAEQRACNDARRNQDGEKLMSHPI
jgi:hypothetical protein